jgi:hypothetical protein
MEWMWYNKLFADFDPINRNNPDNRHQPYSFPAYSVVNGSVSVPFHMASLPAVVRLNGYNLLDSIHIVKGQDGTHNNLQDFRGFWSFGMNFNLTLKVYL